MALLANLTENFYHLQQEHIYLENTAYVGLSSNSKIFRLTCASSKGDKGVFKVNVSPKKKSTSSYDPSFCEIIHNDTYEDLTEGE